MEKREDWYKYADIINLPHHVSPTRPKMSMVDRGAQFSPFAALTGHGAAIKETARLTDERMELTEAARDELDQKLIWALECGCTVSITYFVQDANKAGGSYHTLRGSIKRADRHRGTILLNSGREIPIEDVCEIEPEQE